MQTTAPFRQWARAEFAKHLSESRVDALEGGLWAHRRRYAHVVHQLLRHGPSDPSLFLRAPAELAGRRAAEWRGRAAALPPPRPPAAGASGSGRSLLTCRRCKGSNVDYVEKQTRSADEPMTVFATCLDCQTRWKE